MGELKLGKSKTVAMLEALCQQEEVVSVGCRVGGLKFVTRFHKKMDFRSGIFYLQYPRNQELFNLEKALLSETVELMSTVKVGPQVWGLNFKFLKTDTTGIQCAFPSEEGIYEINRRQSVRYKIPKDSVEFKLFLSDFGRTFPTEVVDISQGGLSFSVPVGTKPLLAFNKLFKDCPLKINHQQFNVDVRLKNMFYFESKLKVGVAFENIEASLLTEILLLVKKGR